MYRDTQLFIGGHWRPASDGARIEVEDPATGQRIGSVASASQEDLESAVVSAHKALLASRSGGVYQRYEVLRKAASLLRERASDIASTLTLEQGKPQPEALGEVQAAAEVLDWAAEEGRRAYGRIVPGRNPGIRQLVLKEPVGVVAAFSPWNFPLSLSATKVGLAIAAGCTVVLKAAEETPGSPAALVRALEDAGLPAGVLNLVFGKPQDISGYLLPHPLVRKVSFTGSTVVGRQLAALAGAHLKRITLELGGHAPVLVFDDSNWQRAAEILVEKKYRNAGQACGSPTRFMVQRRIFDDFTERFVQLASKIEVGPGMSASTRMGPVAHGRRIEAMEDFVEDFRRVGAEIALGGRRIGNEGYFFEPTVVLNAPASSKAMNLEPFGPMAMISSFDDDEEAIAEANRLNYGLASYAYTSSTERSMMLSSRVEAGTVSINHHGVGLAENPQGGLKDSGYGYEGGSEGLEAYLTTKLVTEVSLPPQRTA